MNRRLFSPSFYFIPHLAFLFLVFVCGASAPTAPAQKLERHFLSDVLKRAAIYCQKLESASLYYVCEEQISEKIYIQMRPGAGAASIPERRFNTWVYDYQLIRGGPTLDERRTLLRRNGQTMNMPNARLETQRFSHKFVVFGPVGLLSSKSQGDFLYEFVKEETVNGEKTYVVDVRPGTSASPQALYGRVWLKTNDSSVLKIQWDQKSMENFPEIERAAVSMNAEPQILFASEYALEKNGLRFPSRYTVEENYVRKNTFRPRAQSVTTVLYKHYRFFTVEVDVKE